MFPNIIKIFPILEKDKYQKIFSLAYINLASRDGTCIQDEQYELAVYKVSINRFTLEIIFGCPFYNCSQIKVFYFITLRISF
jgi:hypothetical protein